jgi:transcriptional regulator with XRE-family HTH domain
MRGLYRRVADRLGVDPSYVSRVARGERKSPKIEASLNRDVSKLLTLAAAKAKVKKK